MKENFGEASRSIPLRRAAAKALSRLYRIASRLCQHGKLSPREGLKGNGTEVEQVLPSPCTAFP